MWAEIIFYNFFSFQSVKSFQYKRFIQTACLFLNYIICKLFVLDSFPFFFLLTFFALNWLKVSCLQYAFSYKLLSRICFNACNNRYILKPGVILQDLCFRSKSDSVTKPSKRPNFLTNLILQKKVCIDIWD